MGINCINSRLSVQPGHNMQVQVPDSNKSMDVVSKKLTAAHSVPATQTINAAPAVLINDKSRINRNVLLNALAGMERTLFRQSYPIPENNKRIFHLLRGSTSQTLQTKPQTKLASLISKLSSKTEQELDIKECALLSLQMERLARILPPEGILSQLSQGLDVVGRAAWAELARESVEQQLVPQFKSYDRPGTSSELRLGGSVGVGVGLEAGVKAKVGLDFMWAKGMDNDDEGFVFQNKSVSLAANTGVKLGLDGVVTMNAGLTGKTKVLRFHEYSSAKAFVHLNAHKLQYGSRRDTLQQGARTVVGALLRLVYKGYGNELQACQALQQQAVNQQQRLSVLLGAVGSPTCPDSLPGPSLQQAGSGYVYSFKAGAGVRADMDAYRAGAGVQINIEKILIKAESKTFIWDRLKDGDDKVAVNKAIARQRLNTLNEKSLRLLGEDKSHKALSRLLASADASAGNVSDIDEINDLPADTLHRAVKSLEVEFDYYCAVIQQRDISKRHLKADAIEISIANSWQGKGREEVFANMLLCHATLGSALLKKQEPMDEVNRLATRLYKPSVLHNSARLLQLSGFCDKLNLEIRDRSYVLDIGGGVVPLGVKVEASLTERERIHHNPVRDGEYKDLRIKITGSLGQALPLDSLLADVFPALQAHGVGDADLAGMTAGLSPEVSAGTTLLLRFYKPRYQTLKDFPAKAAGYRLQLLRVSQSADLATSLSGSIPAQPGVSAELGMTIGRSGSDVLLERWGSNTLSGPMMHYFHLCQVEELDERWNTLCETQYGPLEKLFNQLADPLSPVHAEAAYFLEQQKAEPELVNQFFAAMSQVTKTDKYSFSLAKNMFDTFLQRQYPQWYQQKNMSPVIQEQEFIG